MSRDDLDLTALDRSFQKASTHPEDPRQQMRHLVLLVKDAQRLFTSLLDGDAPNLEFWGHVKDWVKAARSIED